MACCIIGSLAARPRILEVGPKEVQQALATVSQALSRLKEHKTVTWLLDSGFDDVAVWRTIWEQQEHLVVRLYHTDRTVTFQDRQREWHEGNIAQAAAELRPLARVETTLEVKRGKQVRPKKQPVQVDLAACPLRVSRLQQCAPQRARPAGDVRRVAGAGARAGGRLGPVAAAHRLAGHRCSECPAYLHHVSATLECGGQFQILENLPGLGRGAIARSAGDPYVSRRCPRVAAGFLYQMGVTFDWVEVQLLAKLGGS